MDVKRRERDLLAEHYRRHHDAEVRRRCHIVLLLDDGPSRKKVQQFTYASAEEVEITLGRFRAGGVEGLLGAESAG